MEEIFKSIQGYEGLYEISNLGKVRSLKRNKLMKPCNHGDGYLVVHLRKRGVSETKLVHVLVAETFLGTCPNGYEVDHIDHNRANNRLDNLRYLPMSENRRNIFNHPYGKKVLQYTLDGEFVREYPSIIEAARDLGCTPQNINKCLRGKGKSAYGHTWQYA